MSDRTFQTKYFSTFSDAKNRIYFKTSNETSRSDFSSKSRKKSSFETAAPLSYLNPCTKQVLQIQFARCCSIRHTVYHILFISNRLYKSPIRAGLHFYFCKKNLVYSPGRVCPCPIRAGLHFYKIKLMAVGVMILTCVNALYGRDCISTFRTCPCLRKNSMCQCPIRAGLHFYVTEAQAWELIKRVCLCPIRAGLHFYPTKERRLPCITIVSMPYTGGTAFLH